MNRNNCVINLQNLLYNLDQIKKHTDKKIIAVVKADAYGHGAVKIADALEGKVSYLAVACFEEALELRSSGIITPILILGHTDLSCFEEAASLNITVTLHDFNQIKEATLNKKLKVHIKADTGMNRIGFNNIEDLKKAITLINDNEMFVLEGIFTHYATADCDDDFYNEQHHKFETWLRSIDYKFMYIHSSNSAATITYGDTITNTIRPGLILYGLNPRNDITFDLKPVLSLYSKVIHLKSIKKGERVGYGNNFTANEDMIVATIPIGYGDGWLRRNAVVPVFINEHYYDIIGRICMDMMMVRVDDTIKLDDEVELIGSHITADLIASKTDTISYEVLCNLGKRLKRNYIK